MTPTQAIHAVIDTEAPPALLRRVRAEYLEMPGLGLTPRQAARLWGVDVAMSQLLLARLAQSGFLWRNHSGAYVRRSSR
jgi:hypothetical protein